MQARKPKIFIVDDIMKNLQVIGGILMDESFDIAMATNGIQALNMVKNIMPDLILLDVMMPDMNGYQVCEKLKSDPDVAHIPVIFLTAKSDTEDIIQGFQIGGVDYITKPFKKEELLVRIKTHIDLKFAVDTIKNQNEQLTKLNNEKNEFLGIAAHDLKNPLSAIMGLSELLLRDDMEFSLEEMKEYTGDINTSAIQMFRLVTDLLDVNAIEQGKINLSLDNFPIAMIVEDCYKNYIKRAEDKSIKLVFENQVADANCFADSAKVGQVIDNLVSNAIKFSPQEKNIFISVFDDDEYLIVEVKDEGPGISSEDQKKMFTKFQKLSARPTGNENSTGLGLSIVKRLVEEMKGKIEVISELGKGASFRLYMPKAQ